MPRGIGREAFRVGGVLLNHSPLPKLLTLRSQFRPPHKGEVITLLILMFQRHAVVLQFDGDA